MEIEVPTGGPHGSYCGAILFILYLKDLPMCFDSNNPIDDVKFLDQLHLLLMHKPSNRQRFIQRTFAGFSIDTLCIL